MTLDELEDLLDRCGGDPDAWPAGARVGAERLLSTSRPAQSLLDAQRRVDLWLASSRNGETARTPTEIASRATRAQQAPPLEPGRRWAAAAAAAILAIGLGFVAGVSGGAQVDRVLAAALSDQAGAFHVG